MAVDKVVDKLKSMSKQVTTPEEIAQVRLYYTHVNTDRNFCTVSGR